MGCNQHSDCPGYGVCRNGKCEFPILGPGPSPEPCDSNYDCGHLGTCVGGQCDYLAVQPYNGGMRQPGALKTRRQARNQALRNGHSGHSDLIHFSTGSSPTAALPTAWMRAGRSSPPPPHPVGSLYGGDPRPTHPLSARQRRQMRNAKLRGENPPTTLQLKDPWPKKLTLKDPWGPGSGSGSGSGSSATRPLTIGWSSPPPPHPVSSLYGGDPRPTHPLSARQRRQMRNAMRRAGDDPSPFYTAQSISR